METLLFILLVYGVTNIIVYNTIPTYVSIVSYIENFSPNWLGKILNCMMCCSTWVGFTLSTLFINMGYEQFSPFMLYGIDNIYLAVFLDGCLVSGTTWLLHTIQEFFERANEEDDNKKVVL